MREILYKAKCTDSCELVEGYYCKRKTGHYTNTQFVEEYKDCIIKEFSDGGISFFDIESKTLCQYTGLTDKNGKKIFEWDIVRRIDLHDAKEPSVGFIEYDAENTAFLIHWTDVKKYSATFPWKDKIKVIGNIFNNPELLKYGS